MCLYLMGNAVGGIERKQRHTDKKTVNQTTHPNLHLKHGGLSQGLTAALSIDIYINR